MLKDLDVFWQVVGTFWKHLEKRSPAASELLKWTPALIREASQFNSAFRMCVETPLNGVSARGNRT